MTISALERPAWRFAAIPSEGDHRRGRSPYISDLAITPLAVIWLQKQPGAAEGDLVAKGQSGNATGPTRWVSVSANLAEQRLGSPCGPVRETNKRASRVSAMRKI